MENSHLTKAHEHARNAATATYGNSVATASEAHAQAAECFHEAAQDTHDAEARRILALLEDHHIKLARLIKAPPRKKEKDGDGATQSSDTATSLPESTSSTRTASSPASTSSPTRERAPSRRRLPHSSIASNLAEKRGIPGGRRGTPTASPVSVTKALASRNDRQSTPAWDLLQQQSKKSGEADKQKEATSNRKAETSQSQDITPPSDDNFRRFYTTFGNIINTISAPLAFTSLPLNPLSSSFSSNTTPEPSPRSPIKPKDNPTHKPHPLEKSRTIKSSEPDLASLISKPALHALRDDQSGPHNPFANNESFYFVPTSGGTLSYANIVRDPRDPQTHQHQHPHHAAQDPHLDSIAEDNAEPPGVSTPATSLLSSTHEEFVDARESIGPPSPSTSRRPRSKATPTSAGVTTASDIRAGTGRGLKTMEELSLENDTLRVLIDKQAKRLSMWETTSQNSYNALAQSFRARGGLKHQMSDPATLAQALSMGSNAAAPVTVSTPPVPEIPPQYRAPQTLSLESDVAKERQRIAELEALLATQASQLNTLSSENQQLSLQNEKDATVIRRYREQWEKLKAGARKKEHERKRIAELKQGAEQAKDSESGENEAGDEVLEDEPGAFGKA